MTRRFGESGSAYTYVDVPDFAACERLALGDADSGG